MPSLLQPLDEETQTTEGELVHKDRALLCNTIKRIHIVTEKCNSRLKSNVENRICQSEISDGKITYY